ncbi:hypothetical protein ACROYT_G037955, partial [Oculina patagonica]
MIHYKAQVENGIIFLLMSLFIKNTATERPQAGTIQWLTVFGYGFLNAYSPEEDGETHEDQQDEDIAMAWKRLRPSALRTVCKSMYIGALISLLTATIIGSVYTMISYVSYKTKLNCQFQPAKSIPIQVQWMRTISGVILAAFHFLWFFLSMLFLFRPYQLMGVKRKLFLVSCLLYCLDAIYRVALQALGISHSKKTTIQKIPLNYNVLFLISACWQ